MVEPDVAGSTRIQAIRLYATLQRDGSAVEYQMYLFHETNIPRRDLLKAMSDRSAVDQEIIGYKFGSHPEVFEAAFKDVVPIYEVYLTEATARINHSSDLFIEILAKGDEYQKYFTRRIATETFLQDLYEINLEKSRQRK